MNRLRVAFLVTLLSIVSFSAGVVCAVPPRLDLAIEQAPPMPAPPEVEIEQAPDPIPAPPPDHRAPPPPPNMVGQAFEHGRAVERLERERTELEAEHASLAGVTVFVHCYAESRGLELDGEVSKQMMAVLERGGDKHTRKCQRLVADLSDAEKIARAEAFVRSGPNPEKEDP